MEVEARDEDHRPAREHRVVHDHREAVDVEERHHREAALEAVPRAVPGVGLEDIRHERAVREHRALRHAGRAAGVLEDREVGGGDLHRHRRRALREDVPEPDRARVARDGNAVPLLVLAREREERPQERREVLLDARDDDVPEAGRACDLLCLGVAAGEHDERLRAGVLELVLQLRCGVERVRRHDDRAGLERAVERDDELRAVREHDRDAVALLDPERLQAGGEPVGETTDVVPGESRVEESRAHHAAVDRRGISRVGPDGLVEEALERYRRIGQGPRDTVVVERVPRSHKPYGTVRP